MKVYRSKSYEQKIQTTYDALIQKWGIEVETQALEGQYGITYVNIFGNKEGKPLILFHGVGDDAALMWIYNAKALGKVFRCYAVDTIGGPGKSVPHKGYDKNFMDVVWIDELLDQLGLDKVYMAGVSNGGYLTQSYLIERPHRVIKAVSIASSVPLGTEKNMMLSLIKVFLPEALFPTDNNVKKLIRKMTGPNANVFTDDPILFEHFKLLMCGFNRKAMLYHKVKPYSEQQVKKIKDKCLYILGKQDPFIMIGGGALIEKVHMNVLWLEDAGHGANHEQSSVVNEAMIQYFNA